MQPLKVISAFENIQISDRFKNETLEVDFEKNVTALYQSISTSEWDKAIAAVKSNPEEARTWVIRHNTHEEPGEASILWRFLPLHSACARRPPSVVISALIRAYPDAAKERDDQGMYPLHYACGNQASVEVVRLLILAYPAAAGEKCTVNGMLPLHYLCQWGPSSMSVLDILTFSDKKMMEEKDWDGDTPLDLARAAEYESKGEVITSLHKLLQQLHYDESVTLISDTKNAQTMFRRQEPIEQTEQKALKISQDQEVDKSNLSLSSRPVEQTPQLTETPASDEDILSASTMKALAKLKAEVNKLRAEAAFNEAEMDEKLLGERAAFDKDVEDLRIKLLESQAGTDELRSEILAKTEFASYVESRLTVKESEFQQAQQSCEKLQEELEKTTMVAEDYKKKCDTLEGRMMAVTSSLRTLTEEQDLILSQFDKTHGYLKQASDMRKQKLQELIEQEAKFATECLVDKNLMPNNNNKGDDIKKALEEQTREMELVSAVISEIGNEQ